MAEKYKHRDFSVYFLRRVDIKRLQLGKDTEKQDKRQSRGLMENMNDMNSVLSGVFDDIILGRGIKRAVHELSYEGRDYGELFRRRLEANGFRERALRDVAVETGWRIPGFWLDGEGRAWFGHLFWEVFSYARKRKIWGSVKRNRKGDWQIILPGNSGQKVFLNPGLKQEVDIYHLTGI